jgi:hypothetical protein
MSTMSALSYQSQALSGQSDGSVLSWQCQHAWAGRRSDGRLDPVVTGAIAGGLALTAAAVWLRLRR